MKNLLSLILCLLLLCSVILLPACVISHGPASCANDHYNDLPPDWAPAAPLPDDAIILNDETGIPDVALYIAVLRAIDRERARHFERTGEGTFTAGEAASVTRITIRPGGTSGELDGFLERDPEHKSLDWQPPRNLRGIEHLRNLEEFRLTLEMEFGQPGGLDSLNELRRLEHLPRLRTFSFGDSLSLCYTIDNLRDLRSMRNLTQLTRLNIFADGLTSLDGIQGLTNLEQLSVRTTNANATGVLSNLRGVEYLTNLRVLNVIRNQLTNLDEVRYLVNLTYLDVSNNQLSDISAVANLPNLQSLNVFRNRLTREQFEMNLPANLLDELEWLEWQVESQHR